MFPSFNETRPTVIGIEPNDGNKSKTHNDNEIKGKETAVNQGESLTSTVILNRVGSSNWIVNGVIRSLQHHREDAVKGALGLLLSQPPGVLQPLQRTLDPVLAIPLLARLVDGGVEDVGGQVPAGLACRAGADLELLDKEHVGKRPALPGIVPLALARLPAPGSNKNVNHVLSPGVIELVEVLNVERAVPFVVFETPADALPEAMPSFCLFYRRGRRSLRMSRSLSGLRRSFCCGFWGWTAF